MTKRTVVLLVLSGWGIGKHDNSNPIYQAAPQNINHIRLNYPAGSLQASGIAVGLPWNEEGNPEVGYLTLGAGKVLYQNYPRISLAIQDGSFFENKALVEAFTKAKEKGGKVNFVGLLGEGTSHSALDHIYALIEMAKRQEVPFALHLFSDGLDSSKGSAARLLAQLPEDRVGSLCGRYFAMDADLHFDRTLRAYAALTGGVAPLSGGKSPVEYAQSLSEQNMAEDFISPTLFHKDLAITKGDAVVFFNFSEDSQRQLARVFVDPEAGGKPNYEIGEREVKKHLIVEDLSLVSLVEYEKALGIKAAFPAERVVNPLGKVIADAGKVQLRVAETQKYAYVTTLFNGMTSKTFPNEYRVLIPSREEAKVDEHPEMRVRDVSGRILNALNEGIYDFILADFSNADAVAHTGNFDAAMQAIGAIDAEVGKLTQAVISSSGVRVITSTHGNVEVMMDLRTGAVDRGDNTSPVPIYIVASGWERQKSEEQAREIEKLNAGVLSDVAPTILELMGIPKAEDMTGISLLNMLR
ncbi:MAG: 2,3-bisphosphoglycerate-independent phosphoglycerate mutase [bacterium]|nr:2,3-bisphosphoglycerate-independent phosphoglycerate mutase [bacterium]